MEGIYGNHDRGELAKRTGVSMATLRYYEDSGILPAPGRSSNGYRVYTEDYLVKIKFIKDAQSLGYSLKEIQDTLQLLSQEDMEKETLKTLVRERITDIQKHIDHLEQLRLIWHDCCIHRRTISTIIFNRSGCKRKSRNRGSFPV